MIKYLGQKAAQDFDVELMSKEIGFVSEQLIELAGLAVAQTAFKLNKSKILILCGPGNNGSDGLISARHLKQFGLNPVVVIFKEVKQEFQVRVLNQLKANNIPIHIGIDKPYANYYNQYDLIIDALLGFSFTPPLREPFLEAISELKHTTTEILSVDIPSGWDVEQGNQLDLFVPQNLISLTLPKLGVQNFKGRHFLGGRFIPQVLQEKYGFIYPPYEGCETIQELPKL